MARWGMVIDLDRCTACQACVVACKVENNVPPAGQEESDRGRSISWMRLARLDLAGHEDNGPQLQLIPLPCMHCENPPCVKVCPATATTIDPEGIVAQVYPRCIGCRYCTTACPYTVRYFNWKKLDWPAPMEQALNPDVSLRPRGVVEKCTFCHHRLQRVRDQARAEGRELEDGEYLPACVETCPAGAMSFGDMDDPHSEVAQLAESPRAFHLMEELGTRPKVTYLARGEWSGSDAHKPGDR